MEDRQVMRDRLSRVARRLRMDATVHAGVGLGIPLIGVWAALAAAARFFDLDLPVGELLLLALGAGTIAVLVLVFRRGLDLRQAARVTDLRLGLRERLSTALEYQDRREHPFVDVLIADAMERIRNVDVRRAAPVRRPRGLVMVPVLLIAGLAFWHFGPVLTGPPAAETDAFVRQEARRLELATRRLQGEAQRRRLPDAGNLLRRIENEARQMRRGRASAQQAQEQVNRLIADVQAQRQMEMPSGLLTRGVQALQGIDQVLRDLSARLQRGPLAPEERFHFNERLWTMRDTAQGELARRLGDVLDSMRARDNQGAQQSINEALQVIRRELGNLRREELLARAQQELQRTQGRLARGPSENQGQVAVAAEQAEAAQREARGNANQAGQMSQEAGQGIGKGSQLEQGDQATERRPTGPQVRLPGQTGKGDSRQTVVAMPSPDNRTVMVPLQQVLPAYARAAEEQLTQDRVPPRYRDWVKRYFQSLTQRE